MDEIYILAAEDLQQAGDANERRKAFRQALLRAFEAGVDAQREVVKRYSHDRPTPLPPPPSEPPPGGATETVDPGLLPPGPRPMRGVYPAPLPREEEEP